jgi:ABC-2 type transport system ATP-binding protein
MTDFAQHSHISSQNDEFTTNCAVKDSQLAIQVWDLHKRYGSLEAVNGINFTVHRGEIFGLIGPDGAGKTSTFHILGGVLAPTSGNVQILGLASQDAGFAIGYLTQQFSLYSDLSIDENLRYSAGIRQVPPYILAQRRAKYLHLMGLERFSSRLAGQLSGGMKQKLALCCTLISQPQILLLDEPTTGVDPVSRREFWDILAAISSEGVTIVVATPYLDEAERCHRVALMYSGQIQQIDTPARLRTSLELQRLEVRISDLKAAESALIRRKIPEIDDVQTFGDRLDVLVPDAQTGIAKVRAVLHQHHLHPKSIEIVEPTLENVFVNRLRSSSSDPTFIAFPYSKKRSGYGHGNVLNPSIAIGADNLKKMFGHFQAVKGVNIEIRYGEIYGLLGANGAGKTTTIKMLCGLLEPTAGKVSLASQTGNLRSRSLRQRIGYMSQKFTLYDDLTVLENLEFYAAVYKIPRKLCRQKIDWVLAICGLVGQENMLVGLLPGGWKQRVAFGASVMHEPEILFLDEPTSGVDPLARRQFWRLIEDLAHQGTAVLVTTHYLDEAEHCNRAGFLVAGELVTQGSPSEIKATQLGELIEIVVDRTQAACSLLQTELAPWRVSIFGSKLHILLDNFDAEIHQIRLLLQAGGVEIYSLRAIPFSLEDTFIAIVQRAKLSGL